MLDDGRLTDNKGRTVNFKNTIIIMTSNMGSSYIQQRFQQTGLTGQALEETKKGVLDMLRQTIRPEFLNRIDDIIMFRPLSQSEIEEIVHLQVESVAHRFEEQGIRLEVAPAAIALVARAGFDPEYGARPVKRALQRLLLDDLSRAILAGTVTSGQPIRVDAQDDHLVFGNA